MPRIRSLKPEIWEDEALSAVSVPARLLFIGLITQADDEGRLKGDPRLIRSQVFPYDEAMTSADVEALLSELDSVNPPESSGASPEGLIRRYVNGQRPFIELCGWKEHQKISHASPSRLPGPFDPDSGTPPEDSPAPPERSSLIKDQGSRIKDQGKTDSSVPAKEPPAEDNAEEVERIFNLWRTATNRNGQTKLTPKRRAALRARLRDCTVEELEQAIRGLATSKWHVESGKTDFELIFRNRERVEFCIDRLNAPPAERVTPPGEPHRFAEYDARIENRRPA